MKPLFKIVSALSAAKQGMDIIINRADKDRDNWFMSNSIFPSLAAMNHTCMHGRLSTRRIFP